METVWSMLAVGCGVAWLAGCEKVNLKYDGKELDMSRVYQSLSVSMREDIEGQKNVYASAVFSLDGFNRSPTLELPASHELAFGGQPMMAPQGMGQYGVNLWHVNLDDACLFRWRTDGGEVYENGCQYGDVVLQSEKPAQISKAVGYAFELARAAAWVGQKATAYIYQYSATSGSATSKQETTVVGEDGAASMTITPEDMVDLSLGTATVSLHVSRVSDQVRGPGPGLLENSVVFAFQVEVIP